MDSCGNSEIFFFLDLPRSSEFLLELRTRNFFLNYFGTLISTAKERITANTSDFFRHVRIWRMELVFTFFSFFIRTLVPIQIWQNRIPAQIYSISKFETFYFVDSGLGHRKKILNPATRRLSFADCSSDGYRRVEFAASSSGLWISLNVKVFLFSLIVLASTSKKMKNGGE
ncbi:unnamed protein product [Rhizophagus irregularis]|nr:unnamed protein product [Rhizophagus irregularis]